MSEKGFVSQEATAEVAKWMDLKFEFKNKLLETVDYSLFYFTLNTLDNQFGELIPDPYKTNIRNIIDAIILTNDLVLVEDKITELMVIAIKVPWLDDSKERMLFSSLINFIISLIIYIVEAKKVAGEIH